MKRTITILTLALLVFTIQVKASKLILRTNAFNARAHISGEIFFSQNGEFKITQLQHGNHNLRISERGRRSGHYSSGKNLIFRGSIFIPRGTTVFARVTPRGRLVIDRVVPSPRNRPHRHETHPRTGRGTDYGTRGGREADRTSHRRNQSYFDVALHQVEQASFDSDKRSIAKQYITANRITSQEVLLLIQALDYESSRLQIAKFAYAYTADPQNYFVVNQGFQYSSSIRSLERFLG